MSEPVAKKYSFTLAVFFVEVFTLLCIRCGKLCDLMYRVYNLTK